MTQEVQSWVGPTEARVNITWAGSNGDLPDPVLFDSTDADVKQWITEAIRTGSVPGILSDPNVDLRDFVVDRFPITDARPYNLIQIRPKTPFGAIARLLKYSFRDTSFKFDGLTKEEQQLVSRDEFEELLEWMKKYG